MVPKAKCALGGGGIEGGHLLPWVGGGLLSGAFRQQTF